jgi:hypothetical protein
MPELSHVEDEKLTALLDELKQAGAHVLSVVRKLIAVGIIPGEVMDSLLKANSDRAVLKERIAIYSPTIH